MVLSCGGQLAGELWVLDGVGRLSVPCLLAFVVCGVYFGCMGWSFLLNVGVGVSVVVYLVSSSMGGARRVATCMVLPWRPV